MERESKKKDRWRCSIVCIDSAPNSFLATELAEKGKCIARFLTSNPQEGDIITALDSILKLLSAPLISDAFLRSNRRATVSEKRKGELFYRIPVGDLIAMHSTWVMGKLSSGRGKVNFALDGSGNAEVVEMRAVGALFAVKQINGLDMLLDRHQNPVDAFRALRALGYRAKEVEAAEGQLIGEGIDPSMDEVIHRLIVNESISSGIISSETAFVAVRNEKGERILGTVIIPNALPRGWDDSFAVSGSPMPTMNQLVMAKDPMMEMELCEMAWPRRSIQSAKGAVRSGPVQGNHTELFSGVLAGVGGQAVLFDGPLVDESTVFEELTMDLDRALGAGSKVNIFIYIGDLAIPRLKVSVEEILMNSGAKPVNIVVQAGEQVRVALVDPNGQVAGARIMISLA